MKNFNKAVKYVFRVMITATSLLLMGDAFSQSNKIKKRQLRNNNQLVIYFNADGNLIDGFKPRYRAIHLKKKPCKDVLVRVLIPEDYYAKDIAEINARFRNLAKQIKNPNSLFCKIIRDCNSPKLQGFLSQEVDSPTLINELLKEKYIPGELSEFIAFTEYLRNLANNRTKPSRADFIKLAPFSLQVNGRTIDTQCVEFISHDKIASTCDCQKSGKNIVIQQFRIARSMFTDDLIADSFLLIKNYPLKKVALDWHKELLTELDNKVFGLKILESRLFEHQALIKDLNKKIQEVKLLENDKNCLLLSNRISELNELICSKIELINENFGKLESTTNICENSQSIFCLRAFRTWYLKTLWLTGGVFRLNPFDFTQPATVQSKIDNNKKENEKLSGQRQLDSIRLVFWDSAIAHLRDSVIRSPRINISIATSMLDSLMLIRKKLSDSIKLNTPKSIPDLMAANEAAYKALSTTSNVLYKGWIIPYKTKDPYSRKGHDKMWLRNYYYDQSPYVRQRFHYTYPENEQVTLLIHNVPAGDSITVLETKEQFADSAQFTVIASEAVSQYSGLYSSLSAIAEPVKNLLNDWNQQSPKDKEVAMISKVIRENSSFVLEVVNQGDSVSQYNITKGDNSYTIDEKIKGEITLDNITVKVNKQRGVDSILNRKNLSLDNITSELKQKRIQNWNNTEIYGKEDSLNFIIKFQKVAKANVLKQVRDSLLAKAILDTVKLLTNNKEVLSTMIKAKFSDIDSLVNRINEMATVKKSTCLDEINEYTMNYYSALSDMVSAPAFMDRPIKERNDSVPAFATVRHQLTDHPAPYQLTYRVDAKRNTEKSSKYRLDSSHIQVGKFRHFQLAAGLAYSSNAKGITSIDTSNGGFKVNRDNDKIRLIGGLRWYPAGLYNQKNPTSIFSDGRFLHRLSLLVAVAIPKPLENVYLGGGYELVPGLNISGGIHFQQANKYSISNNQIVERSTTYNQYLFIATTIDPNLFTMAVKKLFQK